MSVSALPPELTSTRSTPRAFSTAERRTDCSRSQPPSSPSVAERRATKTAPAGGPVRRREGDEQRLAGGPDRANGVDDLEQQPGAAGEAATVGVRAVVGE